MKYYGHFSLVYLQRGSKEFRRHYRVEISADMFEHPGGMLRRIARREFERQDANGLSIGGVEAGGVDAIARNSRSSVVPMTVKAREPFV